MGRGKTRTAAAGRGTWDPYTRAVAQMNAQSVAQFLDAVGAKSPTPGGGAVASVVGALAAALGKMVVEYSVGKKSLERNRPELERALGALSRARAVLMELAEEDAAAYAKVSELMKLPETDEHRRSQWGTAVTVAVQVPRAVAAACCDLLRLVEDLAPVTNTNLRSDLAIAAVLAEGAARSAWWNVAVNLPLLEDEGERKAVREGTLRMLAEAAERVKRVEAACGA